MSLREIGMSGAGLNIGETNKKNLASRRMKRGECPTCGNKTHKVGFFGKRTALTIEGTCLYGRCLLCNPVEGYMKRPQENPVVPRNLVITTEDHLPDDGTMVSGITMDHRLIVGARNWTGPILHDDDDSLDDSQNISFGRGGPMRPEPSVGTIGIDDGRPPDRRRPSRGGDEGSFISGGGRPPAPPKRYTSRHEHMMDNVGMDAVRAADGIRERSNSRRFRRRASEKRIGIPEDASAGTSQREASPAARRVVSPPRSRRSLSPPVEDRYNEDRFSNVDTFDQRTPTPDSDSREFHTKPYGGSSVDRGPERRVDNSFPYKNNNDVGPPEIARDSIWEDRPREFGLNRETHFDGGGNGETKRDFAPREGDFRGSGNSYTKQAAARNDDENGDVRYSADIPPRHAYSTSMSQDRGQRANLDFNERSVSLGPHDLPSPAVSKSKHDDYGRDDYEWRRGDFKRNDDFGRHNDYVPDRGYNGARPPSSASTRPPADGAPLVDRIRRGMPDDDFPESPRQPVAVASASRKMPDANVHAPPQLVGIQDDYADLPEDRAAMATDDPTLKKNQTVTDIPVIIHCLNLDNANPKLRERAFNSLADIALSHGQKAKDMVKEYSGIETLVQSMWADMGNVAAQAAACKLLFALAASVDGEAKNDVLVGDSAEGAVDALLISMQTHLSSESIQRSGCGTLCCLASASGSNPEMSDGTLSGAVLSIVSAMDMHKKSIGVQEWGIRALYSQCLLSANAESNKNSLARSGRDGGPGVDVIHVAMETAKADLVTIELACRLYWCLSSSEECAKILATTSEPIVAIMNAVHLYRKRPEAAAMTEAAYGALANLARITDKTHGSLRDSGVISAAVESIGAFHYDEELYVEACALLNNLSLNPANKSEILSYDAVNIISRLMHHYSHNATLQEEALGALLSLSADSLQAKMSMISDQTISTVVRLIRDEKSSVTMKELACSLLCSLSVQKEGAAMAASNGAIEAIFQAMTDYPRERRLQEAALMTLRNFACQACGVDILLRIGSIQRFVSVMQAMSESVVVQLNACCAMWNLAANAKKEPTTIHDGGGIEQIVRAMQSHMESGELLEMACGALWSLIDRSVDRKKSMVGSGAIDAVTCALVMHPKEPQTLEKACGLLANICTQSMMAEAIADSQGIQMVVEAMRSNITALTLLELGTLVLRNLVLVNPEYAMEASNGISTIINAMKENPEAVSFQLEACNALWALAAQSEDCKSKIVALDGVQILMSALENNTPNDVQDAARGAINQLARSGGGL